MIINESNLFEVFEEVRKFERENKLLICTPYDYQLKFMNASKHFKQRFMRAGNRVGKTYGAALEFAQHVTGLYQPYFNGEVIRGSGHIFWCIGVDLDQTAKVMQKELFGTSDIRLLDEVGTGAIPKHCIDLDSVIKDGARVISIRVKHVSGGFNTIHFYGALTGQSKLMGQAVKFVWIDEEPEFRSLELYAQCVTRTATTDGQVMLTATPEHGLTDLNRLYDEDETGLLFLLSVGWDDCPHLDDTIKNNLLAGFPEYQHEMRMRGLPVLGSGAVFPFADSSLFVPEIPILSHWSILAGVDFGETVDPSVIMYGAHDPDNDVYYIYAETYLDEDRSPQEMARHILESDTPSIPVIVPHDAGMNSGNPEGKGMMLSAAGVNVIREPFRNPSHLIMNINGKGSGQSVRGIETGLTEMRRLMNEGKLKVHSSCRNWFREKATYFYRQTAQGKVEPTKKDNHCIDASRYLILSLIGGRGTPKAQCTGNIIDMNNGFIQHEDAPVIPHF